MRVKEDCAWRYVTDQCGKTKLLVGSGLYFATLQALEHVQTLGRLIVCVEMSKAEGGVRGASFRDGEEWKAMEKAYVRVEWEDLTRAGVRGLGRRLDIEGRV